MPLSHRGEYNPLVLGFVEGEGPVSVPLQAARERYGQFPSEYGLLTDATSRRVRKTLNLSLGLATLAHFRQGVDLREQISRFYERWYRDYRADFHLDLEPFLRRNDPGLVKRVLMENSDVIGGCRDTDVRQYLHERRLVAPSTLQSIPDDALLTKTRAILAKKARNPAHRGDRPAIEDALGFLDARRLLSRLSDLAGGDVLTFGATRLAVQADQIAGLLCRLDGVLGLAGSGYLECVRGRGVEFELAARDETFLTLGKEVGDCTADKSVRQVDRDIENIYWTVFAWFLDRHYQVLKVFHDGDFVMKVHLLPLHVTTEAGEATILGVDAIETARTFREDTRVGRASLLEQKEAIFGAVVKEVVRVAHATGIEHVFAERFSNTGWVRTELEQFPEIYLRIGDIRKIDDLEDVFDLARRVCTSAGLEPPGSVFMELQMKNAFLQPGVVSLKGVKPFAVLAGDRKLGLPMKRVIGV